MKKAVFVILKVLGIFLAALLVFISLSIAPVDRNLPEAFVYYDRMMSSIDHKLQDPPALDGSPYSIGFGKASITPSFTTPTAGYVKRKGAHFSGVRDSIFVRTMVIRQEQTEVAMVSLDMLIVPPLLYNQLAVELPESDFSIDQVYLGATHSHNSIGQWDDHLVGEIYAGGYNEELIAFLARQIVASIRQARADIQPGVLRYASIPVRSAVNNRLIRGGPVDSLLHMVEVVREDGTRGMLTSYSAHATCMSSADLRLSRDYPGELVDKIESNGYAFAMFMAGAVGSHAPASGADGDEKIKAMASMLFEATYSAEWKELKVSGLEFYRIPLQLGKQQIKILPNWRVREWLSLRLLGEHPSALTVLRIGDLVLFGTPCDFSGLLTHPVYQRARELQVYALVTSFNGGYIGYITPDEYYDLEKYETQTMNWYGPGNGTYIQECLLDIMDGVVR
jgi:neutral ceramidase